MRSRILAGIVLAALFTAPAPAQTVKAGIEAWQRGDHAEAVAIWRPLAEAGDTDASFNLGQAYRLGRGVPTNLGTAQTWLERAARKDHLDAQATLGLLLFQNGNLQGGLRWLKMAAERGEPRALLVYGTALYNGDGVRPDPVLAYAYVSRAAALGLSAAKETLLQLDEVMPLDQRKKGLALALEKAKQAETTAAEAKAKTKPASKPARSAVSEAKPKAKAPAPVQASGSGPWRIQLGAFSKRASAESLYERLKGSAPVAGLQPFIVPAGAVTRLQVGPFQSRAAATGACKVLTAKGQPCFPVAVK